MEHQTQQPIQEEIKNKPPVKTNWKLLAIVAVFASTAIGAILVLRNDVRNQVSHIPTPQPQISDTFNWHTYRNEKFDIEFKHPSYWIVEEYDETTDSVINANHVDFSDDTDNNLTYSSRFGFRVYQNPKRLPLRDYLIQEKVNIMYPLELDQELSREEIERRLKEWRVTTFKGYDSLQNPENTKLFISVGQNVFMLYMDSLVEGTNSFADSPFDQILDTFRFINDSTSTWKTFQSERFVFEFQYPNDWEVGEYAPGALHLIGVLPLTSERLPYIGISSYNRTISGISYCEAYPDHKGRCEKFISGNASGMIEWFEDYPTHATALIDLSGEVTLAVSLGGIGQFNKISEEIKEFFRTFVSTFRFVE